MTSCLATTACHSVGASRICAQQRVCSLVWLFLWSIGPVVLSGWSKALPFWEGTIWAGCHGEHRARSSQLGLVEAGSRSWLVAGVSLRIREDRRWEGYHCPYYPQPLELRLGGDWRLIVLGHEAWYHF